MNAVEIETDIIVAVVAFKQIKNRDAGREPLEIGHKIDSFAGRNFQPLVGGDVFGPDEFIGHIAPIGIEPGRWLELNRTGAGNPLLIERLGQLGHSRGFLGKAQV